jgi:hypothetical protein
MVWQDLVKIALIGTDKATPSVSTLENLENMGISTVDTAEIVLEGAGVLTLLRKAGFPLIDFKETLPEMCELEILKACTSKSAQHLKEILFGKKVKVMGEAFIEFIFHAQKNNKILPYEFLPSLFHLFRGDNKMNGILKAVIGKRGTWLAKQNPDWFVYMQETVENIDFISFSKEETLVKARELVELLKAQSFVWADDKKINAETKEFAFKADFNLMENLDYLFSNNLPFAYQNKIQDILNILHFRREMVKELNN